MWPSPRAMLNDHPLQTPSGQGQSWEQVDILSLTHRLSLTPRPSSRARGTTPTLPRPLVWEGSFPLEVGATPKWPREGGSPVLGLQATVERGLLCGQWESLDHAALGLREKVAPGDGRAPTGEAGLTGVPAPSRYRPPKEGVLRLPLLCHRPGWSVSEPPGWTVPTDIRLWLGVQKA